jgi:nucleotide-binding universal stress UspA family protein
MNYAVEMAKLFDDEIILLHVVSESIFSSIFTGSEHKRLMQDGIDGRLNGQREQILSAWPEARVKTITEEGKPYKIINRVAEERECDTIVMGVTGSHGIDVFVGSTTSRVIQSSTVPVIAVKEKRTPKFDTIVLPIDLTKSSKQKVSWAIKFAQRYSSTVHVIMEVEKDEFLKNKVNANLKVVENYLKDAKVNYVSKLLDDRKYPDHIGKDTVQYAEEIEADLIMIMTQEELKMRDLFMGSYAQQVVNSSQRTPVMAINPKKTTHFEGSEGFY